MIAIAVNNHKQDLEEICIFTFILLHFTSFYSYAEVEIKNSSLEANRASRIQFQRDSTMNKWPSSFEISVEFGGLEGYLLQDFMSPFRKSGAMGP